MDVRVAIDFPTETPTVDPLTDYYVLLHDFETRRYNYMPRSLYEDGLRDDRGYPEVVPFVERKGMTWNKEIVWFMFNLCLLSQYGCVYKSPGWNALTTEKKRRAASEFETAFDSGRFITNNTGLDKSYNPVSEAVLGESHRSTLAKQWEVACGGNIVRAVSHNSVTKVASDQNGNSNPVECIQVEVWDGKNPEPNAMTFNWLTHPHLVHRATNSTPFGFDGAVRRSPPWRVDPFPFFQGRGTPYTLLFSSPNYVPLHRVRRLRQSELPVRPYVP